MAKLSIACVIALIGMVVAAPQSIQQPRQVAPGPANFQSDQRPVGANEEAKDLQGAGSIGYGYYGGYPYSGYSSAYYGSYPHFGYGGYPYYNRGFGGLYGGYWY